MRGDYSAAFFNTHSYKSTVNECLASLLLRGRGGFPPQSQQEKLIFPNKRPALKMSTFYINKPGLFFAKHPVSLTL